MSVRISLVASALIATSLVSSAAQAALQGRDLDGNTATYEAYYDTDLDITWLADANYAKTSGYVPSGAMNWSQANAWAANLSFTDGVKVYDDWRLPTVGDAGSVCQYAYAGTNCGYNVNTGEMAHLFYEELGNKAYYDTSGIGPQADWGLSNTGPFINIDKYSWLVFWYSTELNTQGGWTFDFWDGLQYADFKYMNNYAWAVSSGDVAVVPEAQTYALMLAGLGLIGWRARHRRQLLTSSR